MTDPVHVRLHVSLLSASLVRSIMARAREAPFDVTSHAAKKMRRRGVNAAQLAQALATGRLVEYHPAADTALLRDEAGVCVVVNLEKRTIVTVFRNNPGDNHATLRTEPYLFGVKTTPSVDWL